MLLLILRPCSVQASHGSCTARTIQWGKRAQRVKKDTDVTLEDTRSACLAPVTSPGKVVSASRFPGISWSTLCSLTLFGHAFSCHVMSCHVMSCHVMIMSCHVDVMSCHVLVITDQYVCISKRRSIKVSYGDSTSEGSYQCDATCDQTCFCVKWVVFVFNMYSWTVQLKNNEKKTMLTWSRLSPKASHLLFLRVFFASSLCLVSEEYWSLSAGLIAHFHFNTCSPGSTVVYTAKFASSSHAVFLSISCWHSPTPAISGHLFPQSEFRHLISDEPRILMQLVWLCGYTETDGNTGEKLQQMTSLPAKNHCIVPAQDAKQVTGSSDDMLRVDAQRQRQCCVRNKNDKKRSVAFQCITNLPLNDVHPELAIAFAENPLWNHADEGCLSVLIMM